ncbi:MAG: endonuclease [Planctomycetaceae bacterium]|nr:endonuclease [Planctomycetaceae bacterium]
MSLDRNERQLQWISALRETLDDQQLSRSERRALKSLLDDWNVTPQERHLLRHLAFELARESLQGTPQAGATLEWLEETVKVLAVDDSQTLVESEAFFSPGNEPRHRLRRLINLARTSIDVCVFTITDDLLTEALIEAVERGIKLRIITDDYKSGDTGSDIERIRKAGAEVRFDCSPHHMHHKFALFDERTLITGSYNWTRAAAEVNEENIIVTSDDNLIRQFSRLFDKLWDDFFEQCPVK